MSPLRVLLDVDGVLCDFLSPFLRLLKAMGIEVSEDDLDGWDVLHHVFQRGLAPRWESLEHLRTAVWNAWGAALPDLQPYPEAIEAVDALRASGAEVYVVTAAMNPRRRNDWLARHFAIESDHVVYTAAKHLVVGDVFVDDRPENVASWARAHVGHAVLFAHPFNRSASWSGLRGRWDVVHQLVNREVRRD